LIAIRNIGLNWLHNLSFKKKILVVFIFVIYVPVLLTGLLLTKGMQDLALENAVTLSAQKVERVEKRIGSVFDTAVTISMKFAGSSELENIVVTEYKNDWDIIETYLNYKEFDEIKVLYKEIEEVRFYVYNQSMIDNWRFMKITPETESEEWYIDAINSDGKIYWGYFDIGNKIYKNPSLCLVRLIRGATGKKLGILIIKIKNQEIDNILKEESFQTFIMNSNNTIVASSNEAYIGKDTDSIDLNIADIRGSGSATTVFEKRKSHVIWQESNYPGSSQSYMVISTFPDEQILYQSNRIYFMGFSIIGIALILSAITVLFVSSILTKRINVISNDMHQVAAGDFNYYPSIAGADEAGKLAQDLYTMVNSVKDLFSEKTEAIQQRNFLLVKQKEIKYKMLISQINPHFLFNTLEAIRMEASYGGNQEIANVVKLLGRLMRRSLNSSAEKISLGEELDIVRSYLDIQKFRYRDRINYKILFSDHLKNIKIIPFIVQPIVENAIIHGLEQKAGHGFIHINTSVVSGVLAIQVDDDGMGMDQESLKVLQNQIERGEEQESSHIGLINIQQRIRLTYGEAYGLQITSRSGSGTTVIIQLPERD
jgi:two-component system sensor histidine kinase YesM